jgi:predicted TIM-barrel fold metal-dependent hydrolase
MKNYGLNLTWRFFEHAQYLSEDQKRDILFNNAARFFKLDKNQFDWPAEKQ